MSLIATVPLTALVIGLARVSAKKRPKFRTPVRSEKNTVRAEIITELILERAGPVILKTLLLELIAFRPIPAICPARGAKPENYWKR